VRGAFAVLVAVMIGCAAAGAQASVQTSRGAGSGTTAPIKTAVFGGADPTGSRTVPYFTDSFTFAGTVYPYRMVGTSPLTSTGTTTVPVAIIPLRFVFADGHVIEPNAVADSLAASPIFQPARFASGVTQYGDAMQRAMFWQRLAGDDYHVLLQQPTILPVATLAVPADKGRYLQAGSAVLGTYHTAVALGLVDSSWFSNAYSVLVQQADVAANALAIVVSRDVFGAYKAMPDNCCVGGFHTAVGSASGNGNQQVQTALWASYWDHAPFVELPTLARDTEILSHEVEEWFADPFLTNYVPSYLLSSFYGCSNLLETGDPLVGVEFRVDDYHLQDAAFFSWFARQTPSIGIKGQYSYLGTLTDLPPLC
jgi:hypothetical protein